MTFESSYFLKFSEKVVEQHILPRAFDLTEKMRRFSYFLLGPRMTGKSTLIRQTLPDALVFDLLDSSVFLDLTSDPSLIEQEIRSDTEIVVIGEIQRAPQLLNEAHRLIETKNVRFLLTASSARRLRRGDVNLLGGRAGILRFHPLVSRELDADFSLSRVLRHGTLPSVYLSDEPSVELKAYVGTYLREEIAAEGLVRNLPAFARFLEVAAHSNGTVVNFANLASDARLPRTTVHEYVYMLKDTLLVHELEAWRKARRRRTVVGSKYFFFDVGVANVIQSQETSRLAPQNGYVFETWLMHELRSWVDYQGRDDNLRFWRTHSGYEVDFLIGDHTAIEVQGKSHVSDRDLRSLIALKDEETFRDYLCVCMESRPRRTRTGIEVLPFRMFLDRLWEGVYG